MFCNECGAQNPDTAKFCNSCGFKMAPVSKVEPVARTEKPEFYSTLDRLQHFNQPASPVPEMPVNSPVAQTANISNPADALTAEVSNPAPIVEKVAPVEKTAPVVVAPAEDEDDFEIDIPITKTVPTPQPKPVAQTEEVDDPLARLSTFKAKTEVQTVKKEASANIDPIEDEYWNDTVTEIESEINAIPKENILKIAGSIVALFVVIAWLIYML